MRRIVALATSAALLVAIPLPTQAGGRSYTAVDLGTLGGASSAAVAVNDVGQVVGNAQTAGGATHAFLWQRGRMTDLGTLPGGSYSTAVDINAHGLVAGNTTDATGNSRAVVWANGRILDLGSLGGDGGSVAIAVNDRGQVLGESSTPDGRWRRFLWHHRTMIDVGPADNYTTAVDVNNRGWFVGTFLAEPNGYPCTCRAGLWRRGALTDLGTLGTTEAWMQSFPTDINNRGVVVGSSATAQEQQHAFVWRNGVMRDLGTLGGPGSRATAINDEGTVIGFAEVAEQVSHPAMWRKGAIKDLTAYGFAVDDEVTDINERGQITGTRAGRATLFR